MEGSLRYHVYLCTSICIMILQQHVIRRVHKIKRNKDENHDHNHHHVVIIVITILIQITTLSSICAWCVLSCQASWIILLL